MLAAWLDLKTRAGDYAAAPRCAHGDTPSLLPHAAPPTHHRLLALMVLADEHFHHGRPDTGMRRLQRVTFQLHQSGHLMLATEASQCLARMHAACGDPASALAWLRRARSAQAMRHSERPTRPPKPGLLEPELEQRRAQRQEAAAHQQRLAVVGRLMSDIHHALGQPIARTQAILAACAVSMPPHMLATALHHVIDQIDQATRLARQLKMFSYRAAPQAMVVVLHDSLREAWDGVALWRPAAAPELSVGGDLATQVRVDTQRLAVLLRILLIEADKSAPMAVMSAHIARGEPFGRMELTCAADCAAETQAVGDTSLGVTLCQEIAQEMGGRLTRAIGTHGRLSFILELPAH